MTTGDGVHVGLVLWRQRVRCGDQLVLLRGLDVAVVGEADVGAGYRPPGVLVDLARRSQYLEWEVRLPGMRERGEDGVVGEREQRRFELRSSLRRPPVDPEHAEVLNACEYPPGIKIVDGSGAIDDHVRSNVNEPVDELRNFVGYLADDDSAGTVTQENHWPGRIRDLGDHFGDIADTAGQGDVLARRRLGLECLQILGEVGRGKASRLPMSRQVERERAPARHHQLGHHLVVVEAATPSAVNEHEGGLLVVGTVRRELAGIAHGRSFSGVACGDWAATSRGYLCPLPGG